MTDKQRTCDVKGCDDDAVVECLICKKVFCSFHFAILHNTSNRRFARHSFKMLRDPKFSVSLRTLPGQYSELIKNNKALSSRMQSSVPFVLEYIENAEKATLEHLDTVTRLAKETDSEIMTLLENQVRDFRILTKYYENVLFIKDLQAMYIDLDNDERYTVARYKTLQEIEERGKGKAEALIEYLKNERGGEAVLLNISLGDLLQECIRYLRLECAYIQGMELNTEPVRVNITDPKTAREIFESIYTRKKIRTYLIFSERFSDTYTKLIQLDESIDIFNEDVRPLEDQYMEDKDVAMVYNFECPFRDPVSVGDVLGRFLRRGGGIVLFTGYAFSDKSKSFRGSLVTDFLDDFTNASGEFREFEEVSWTPWDADGKDRGNIIDGKKVKTWFHVHNTAKHKILQDVVSLDMGLFGWHLRILDRDLNPTRWRILLRWPDQSVLLAERLVLPEGCGRLVVMNFLPVLEYKGDEPNIYCADSKGGIGKMLSNAISYCSKRKIFKFNDLVDD